ncbi:MAG: response regulator [Nitrososphaerales archaeon]
MKFLVPRRNLTIVIVDDSRELVGVYEHYFKVAGLRVLEKFYSARDALNYFDSGENAAAASVVLVDQRLTGMSGLETARQIKLVNPNQRIILTVSGKVEFKIDEKFFDGMVVKPFAMTEFLAEIERVTSPITIKGSRIFDDYEEIENLLRDIVSDSNEKLCSVRSPTLIRRGLHNNGHTASYVAATSKGLKVFLVTEVTRENLAYCKQLMLNRGVKLRHLEGVVPNFAVWDEKHSAESVLASSPSIPDGRVLYSNLESKVSQNKYLFEYLWNIATPAEEKIRELEASPDLNKASVVSGYDELLKIRLKVVREARASLDICALSQMVSKVIIPSLSQDHVDAIARGVRNRYLYEITSQEDVDSAKMLTNIGIDVRHLKNSVALFGVSEKACIWMVTVKDVGKNEETRGMYSTSPDYVEQYRSIFEVLWSSATPAVERIKEIEETQENEIRNN